MKTVDTWWQRPSFIEVLFYVVAWCITYLQPIKTVLVTFNKALLKWPVRWRGGVKSSYYYIYIQNIRFFETAHNDNLSIHVQLCVHFWTQTHFPCLGHSKTLWLWTNLKEHYTHDLLRSCNGNLGVIICIYNSIILDYKRKKINWIESDQRVLHTGWLAIRPAAPPRHHCVRWVCSAQRCTGYYYDTHHQLKKLIDNLGPRRCLLEDWSDSERGDCLLRRAIIIL